MVTAPTLIDGPVTLRHPRESDVQGSWEQCQDPLSQQWTTVPIPYSHADARDFMLGFVPGAWESDEEWGFVVEAEGRYAGHVALRNKGDRRGEIAYGSHPWVRGTGHVEHALRMLLDWGFREKDLATVIWLANVGNWASRRVAWKLGFAFEGTLRQWLSHRGELRDAWVGTLLAGDPREPQGRWIDDAVLERGGGAAPAVPGGRRRSRGGGLPGGAHHALAGRAARAVHRGRRAVVHPRTDRVAGVGPRAELGGRRPGDRCAAGLGRPLRRHRRPGVRRGRLLDAPRGPWSRRDDGGRRAGAGARLRAARAAPGQGLRRPRQRARPATCSRPTASSSTGWSASGRSSPRAGSMPCCTTSCVRSGHAGPRSTDRLVRQVPVAEMARRRREVHCDGR